MSLIGTCDRERLTVSSRPDIEYIYSGSTNNGRIVQSVDHTTGETTSYGYDTLNRLASVNAGASTLGGAWGSTYAYDGFGNLTSKTPTAGSAPQLSLTPDPLTNRTTATPGHYDDTGNPIYQNGQFNAGYDVANRMVTYTPTTGGGESYAYDPDNLRVWKMTSSPQEYFYFYGAQGERLGIFKLAASVTAVQRSLYFGQRLVTNIVPGTTTQYTGRFRDRLGSTHDAPTYSGYYPYGEEHGSAMSNDTDRFATYFRDNISGLDYAKNRYYSSILGRFMTPDPYRNSAGPADPGSWNRYAYTTGDPVNRIDPFGLDDCAPSPGIDFCATGTSSSPSSSDGGSTVDPSLLNFVFHFSTSPGTPKPKKAKDVALDLANSLLDAAEEVANAAIGNKDCSGLFGSRSDGLTASQVLAGMERGTAYGKIQFSYNPNDKNVASTRATLSPGNIFGVTSTVTKINSGLDSYGYWNNGDNVENADTILALPRPHGNFDGFLIRTEPSMLVDESSKMMAVV